jgi:hypothetical protein
MIVIYAGKGCGGRCGVRRARMVRRRLTLAAYGEAVWS